MKTKFLKLRNCCKSLSVISIHKIPLGAMWLNNKNFYTTLLDIIVSWFIMIIFVIGLLVSLKNLGQI